jgi:hypothetical protein
MCKNLKDDMIILEGKGKSYSEYTSIVINNLSLVFKSFTIIFYNIPLFMKNYKIPSLEKVFSNLIQCQVTLRNMGELQHEIKPIQGLSQHLLRMSRSRLRGKLKVLQEEETYLQFLS